MISLYTVPTRAIVLAAGTGRRSKPSRMHTGPAENRTIMIVYSNMRFLVVDDFSDFRSSVKGMLGQMAAQHIDIAANGEEALSLCRLVFNGAD